MRHLLLFLALPILPGCYRLMSFVSDTAAPPDAAGGDEPGVVERTHTTADMKASARERHDIEAVCAAVVDHDRRGTPKGQDVGAYTIETQSRWGTEIVKHLNAEGRHAVGPRLARLLRDEQMKWSSADCRTVIKAYSDFN